ncbi:MAG: DUF4062 domain-containing protein [Bacteroidales bacterium]|nr:DUF4062 domain-containing protein [Bacteroidales bacterium]
MNRKTVFISSVQNEFATQRKLLADYIRQDALFSMYFEPFLFEELPAQDRSAQTAYLEQAANAEVYLLLMGEKYGYEDVDGIHQDEDFRVVLWRPEVQEGGTETLLVDKKIIRIIQAIRGDTKTAREIMATMQLKGEDNFRKRYLHPSIDFGYVSGLYHDAYKRRDQAYYLTDKGLKLLSKLLKK